MLSALRSWLGVTVCALVLLGAAHLANAESEQQITITSPDVFSVMATVRGRATYDPPFLRVSLTDATLRGNSKFNKFSHVTGYRIGIAFHNGTPGWETKRWTALQPLNADVGVDSTVDLGKLGLSIPIDGLSLTGSWLVFEVQLRGPDGKFGTTYAHSEPLRFP